MRSQGLEREGMFVEPGEGGLASMAPHTTRATHRLWGGPRAQSPQAARCGACFSATPRAVRMRGTKAEPVEGRNGYLSLRNHQLRGLDHPRKRSCLTAMHNFFLTRADGTTAAERFFGQKPRSMFAAIAPRYATSFH